MMYDTMGNSYLNQVTPLYYYPSQNGFNYGAPRYGYQNLESNGPDVGVSSGSIMNDFADDEHSQNAAADTELYHYYGAEHPALVYTESSADKKKTQEQNQPLLHHLLQ